LLTAGHLRRFGDLGKAFVMPVSRSSAALEIASCADLRTLVPGPREPAALPGPAETPADEVALYIAELIAEAPPLPATVARLLRNS
jgi:hypothetical protein